MSQLSLFPSDKKSEKSTITLFIDGASRGNPGPSSVGCVIKRDGTVIKEHGYYLGKKTNNQAEYAALLVGLHFVAQIIQHQDELLVVSDSELLVKQLNGHYRVKDIILQKFYARAKHMLKDIDHRITHVLRAHNSHADMLANKALDQKIKLPDDLLHLVQDA
jgi:ribonuclease HI